MRDEISDKPAEKNQQESNGGIQAALQEIWGPSPAKEISTPVKQSTGSSSSDDDRKKEVQGYIKQLGDESFEVRQQASQALLKAGLSALPQIEKALDDPDLEVRTRAKELMKEQLEGGALSIDERNLIDCKLGGVHPRTGPIPGNRTQLNVDEARKFADDPKKTGDRISKIGEILSMADRKEDDERGKLHLTDDQKKTLQRELEHLQSINSICSLVERFRSGELYAQGNNAAAKEMLQSSIKHDPSSAASKEVKNRIVDCDFDKDQDFMKWYQQQLGDQAQAVMDEIKKLRETADNDGLQSWPNLRRIFPVRPQAPMPQ